MPLLHAGNLRILLAGAAVAHLSSYSPTTRASPCAPPPPPRLRTSQPPPLPSSSSPSPSRVLASADAACEQGAKPSICTADELHYAPVPGTEWRLALWRYRPPPEAPKRNHPLMLLSGVATNAIGFDLSPGMDYIRQQSVTKDGKLLAIGHSMVGIFLYAMVSKCGFEGAEPELAAIVTLASSVDYTTSNSSLKLLLPLADPAEMLRVPAVPLGTLLSTTYPISSRAPYILSLLCSQISAKNMMDPELLSKLILNNFCTVPAKVLIQLTTAFRDGGLRNRTGTFFFKEHLHKIKVPVLALAGDEDLICPPDAVYETVKLIPQHLVTYKVIGKPQGPHYAHYDLVGGRKAVHEVYPCIMEFLSQHDKVSS